MRILIIFVLVCVVGYFVYQNRVMTARSAAVEQVGPDQHLPSRGKIVCSPCHGEGYLVRKTTAGARKQQSVRYRCPVCQGIGYTVAGEINRQYKICPDCAGFGRRLQPYQQNAWTHWYIGVRCARCASRGMVKSSALN